MTLPPTREQDQSALQPTHHTTKLELVFVDTSTPDYQQHLDDILASGDTRAFDVVLIDGSDDGVGLLSATLSQCQNIDAVHVISHGSHGMTLGSTQLDQQYLNHFSGIFSSWSDAFSAHADLLLYGCDLTCSASGRSFANTLGRLTGTDVSTSDETSFGADWSFEYRTAAVETSPAISALA